MVDVGLEASPQPWMTCPRPERLARMSDLVIRPATAADCGLILAFIRELAEFEQLAGEVVATDELLADQLFGAGRRGAEAVIAEVGGAPVGYALFFPSFSTFLGRNGLYLEDLYVRPAHRSRGHGRRLLAHVARLAVERGCGRLEWSVLDWNARALAFYRSVGATPMTGWTVQRLTGPSLTALAAE
jgi:GNAT superfamily N-acetyltransferase